MPKKKTVFLSVGDYPPSWYTTPDDVKELLYEQAYALMKKDPPRYAETGEELGGGDEFLRSLATGLVQAKLGWVRGGVILRVSEEDAEKVKQAKKHAQNRKAGIKPPTEEERAADQADAAAGTMPRRTVKISDATIAEAGAIREQESARQPRLACSWHKQGGYGWTWDCRNCNPDHPAYRVDTPKSQE